MPGFYQVVHGRRSTRGYRPDPIPEETIIKLLEAANAAPSAHNSQPWHFYVLREAQAKRRVMEAAGDAFAADLAAQGLTRKAAEAKAAQSVAYFTAVPALIVAFATDAGAKAPHAIEPALRMQSVAAAVTQLLLAAEAEGLGACWYGLPLYCPRAMREALGAPPSWSPQALITLGMADGRAPRREKLPAPSAYTLR